VPSSSLVSISTQPHPASTFHNTAIELLLNHTKWLPHTSPQQQPHQGQQHRHGKLNPTPSPLSLSLSSPTFTVYSNKIPHAAKLNSHPILACDVGKVRAVDCCLNQPEMWLILAIDSIRGGYLFLVESTVVDLRLNQLEISMKVTAVDLWLIQAALSLVDG
jgi:hypothetical protein